MNAWVLHQNKDVYGPDPENFRPERWIGKEKTSLMESMMFAVRHPFEHNYTTGVYANRSSFIVWRRVSNLHR